MQRHEQIPAGFTAINAILLIDDPVAIQVQGDKPGIAIRIDLDIKAVSVPLERPLQRHGLGRGSRSQ